MKSNRACIFAESARLASLTAAAVLLVIAMVASTSAQPPPDEAGNYLDSPVFYERFDEPHYPNEQNLAALRGGWLTLPHFPPVDVNTFDWVSGSIDDYSWWIQVEELRFLLPFIQSGRSGNMELAKSWFDSWYSIERINPHVNLARWGEPMTVAYRGMVLVYLLKIEASRPTPDAELIRSLRDTIFKHREYLADEDHFDANSNHGLVESVGLLEVARVFPEGEYAQLALERMSDIVRASVSERGSHMEHSPGYHFAFLNLLDRYVAYMSDLSVIDKVLVDDLIVCRDRMLKTAYYMQDHGGTVAQIGDTDSVRVADRYPQFHTTDAGYRPEVFLDAEAGFAVYKGNSRRGDRRFVVFAIQSAPPKMFFHQHDDALSVYYSHDGETLLGDPGKFEYTVTKERRFFVSPVAHNTVFPIEYLTTRKPGYNFFAVDTATVEAGPCGVTLGASIRHTSASVERVVFVPSDGGLTIVDSIVQGAAGAAAPESDENSKPLYTAMVWNVGHDVVSLDAVDTGDDKEYEWVLTSRSGRRFSMRIGINGGPEGAYFNVKVLRGSHHPMAGWYSPALFVKRPSAAILLTVRPKWAVRVTTRVVPLESRVPFALRILLRGY